MAWHFLQGKRARWFGVALLLFSLPASAEEQSAWKISGFASLVAGSVISGSRHEELPGPDIQCPCLITDWANAGMYEGSTIDAKPDSKAALQLSYRAHNDLSFTSQVISRGTDTTPNLQWAYLSYDINPQWNIDVGRKRIPFFYYSDFQDLQFASPMITPPGEVYGWEATNYNGASLTYKNYWDYFQITTSIFGGSEHDNNSANFETVTTQSVDSDWNDLVGANIEVARDWLTLRFTRLKTNVDWYYSEDMAHYKNDLDVYNFAIKADFSNWFFLTEYSQNYRQWPTVGDIGMQTISAFSVGAGYRLHNRWTLFANYAGYKDKADDPAYEGTQFYTSTLTARYDLNKRSDIKIQWDYHDDKTVDYSGDANLLRISYDIIF